jgi:hypothetical protein
MKTLYAFSLQERLVFWKGEIESESIRAQDGEVLYFSVFAFVVTS